jgi:hypothetical protein
VGVTRRAARRLAGAGSLVAFPVAFFLRMDAAYGPFNLSLHAGDWTVVWELWRHGQIAPGIVAQSVGLGVAAAAIPWVVVGWLARRRQAR